MIDRRRLRNGNGIICGVPGSGVHFCAKQDMLHVLRTSEDEVIVIDLDGEYTVLAEEMGGEVVRLGGSNPIHLNPLDVNEACVEDVEDVGDFITSKSEFLISICEVLTGGCYALTARQRTIIDRCTWLAYERYFNSYDERTRTHHKEELLPTLLDFYNELCKQNGNEVFSLRLALEPYVKGSFDLLSGKTNFTFKSKFTVFDFHDADFTTRRLASLVVLEHIWNYFAGSLDERVQCDPYKHIWFYIDDATTFFRFNSDAEYLAKLRKRVRPYPFIFTLVTKRMSELLKNDIGRSMLGNCEFVQMLQQADCDREYLSKIFNIPRKYVSLLADGKPGEGLLLIGSAFRLFRQSYSEKEKLCERIPLGTKEAEKNNALVLGKPGGASRGRCFEEKEFRPELVPDYVTTISIIKDSRTGKRYFMYVDTYGKEA